MVYNIFRVYNNSILDRIISNKYKKFIELKINKKYYRLT